MAEDKPIVEQVPVVDTETKKVTEEELKSIQELNSVMQQITMAVGQSVLSVLKMGDDFKVQQEKLNELSKSLEDTYGQVNININDGSITPIETPEDSK
tara:strand:- start:113 stop:406 length:294 start_codon:yes stop_codon:yes gene_type:complete